MNLREGRIHGSLDGGKIINGVILILKSKKYSFEKTEKVKIKSLLIAS